MTRIVSVFRGDLSVTGLWTFEYPKHVSFSCNRCGRCCGDTEDTVRHILLLKTDADSISSQTSLDISEFAEEISGFKPYIYEMRKTEESKCFFLKNNLCTIYKIRPLICIFYPFQLKDIGNNRYAFSYTNNCPSIGKGLQLKSMFFEGLFKKVVNAIEENARVNGHFRSDI